MLSYAIGCPKVKTIARIRLIGKCSRNPGSFFCVCFGTKNKMVIDCILRIKHRKTEKKPENECFHEFKMILENGKYKAVPVIPSCTVLIFLNRVALDVPEHVFNPFFFVLQNHISGGLTHRLKIGTNHRDAQQLF